ncbi:hypothetical protein R1sor_015064 [Riccia sorocarpa]|uniref:Uncharacterized protein n=1 Tax=Riccia sorocarpa TaxID=122646 RepID=A0ABD3HB69_9MARC
MYLWLPVEDREKGEEWRLELLDAGAEGADKCAKADFHSALCRVDEKYSSEANEDELGKGKEREEKRQETTGERESAHTVGGRLGTRAASSR